MKILVLGVEGMLGHVVKRYFENKGYEVFATSRDKQSENYFDLTDNIKNIDEIVARIKPQVVINCIGLLNKVAEENQALAVLINSYLPHYMDELSEKENFKFIHVSTDCVFDGKKGKYTTDSFKDAYSFYGQSKALGELNNKRSVTLRTSIVGPDENPNGIGLFQWFMNQGNEAKGFSKVIWTGITTIQFAKCMEEAIEKDLAGLYHAVNGEEIAKADLLRLFAKYFKPSTKVIDDASYVSNKSLALNEDDYRFNIPSYEKMVEEMKQWVLENKDLYPNLLKKMEE